MGQLISFTIQNFVQISLTPINRTYDESSINIWHGIHDYYVMTMATIAFKIVN